MRHVCLGRFGKSDLLDEALPLIAMVAKSSLSDSELDRGGVPELSVSGDNFDLVEDDPHDPTTTSESEAPMQSLNQLSVVTNLVDARSA
jgi:hypothetical protein